MVDHINGDGRDNRRANLRIVTNQQNSWNQTKAKGYYWSPSKNKWCATIHTNGKTKNLGYYDSEVEARSAYLEAKKKYHTL